MYCGISIEADATGIGIPASSQTQILLVFWYSLLPEKVYKKIPYGKVLQYAELSPKRSVRKTACWNLDSTVLFILHLVWDIEEKSQIIDADICLLVYLLYIFYGFPEYSIHVTNLRAYVYHSIYILRNRALFFSLP